MDGIRAILFDYGHTLVDFVRTEEALHEAYGRIRELLCSTAEATAPDVDALIEHVALAVDAAVERSYEERDLEELDVIATIDSSFRRLGLDLPRETIIQAVALDHSAVSGSLQPDPLVSSTLEELRERGFRLGIVSNAHFLAEYMRADLARLGLSHFFSAEAFSSEVGVRKPHPRIFQHVLGRLGVSADEAIFVGDRVKDDIVGARRVGMRLAVLTRQFRQEEDGQGLADAVIQSLPELLDLVPSHLGDTRL
ncbi:MAG: HAD family hydrolase [Actinomycetota bacterium]